MVGLKTFWILISSLFLFAACVPQTKQTECGANEAFNASLRTCVPIVGGPSSFINIASYTPSFTQTRYKDDTTTLSFTITVANPYAQAYTISWERTFNAAPVTMCSNAPTCSFSAALLGALGEVGTHILTAKIKDGNGTTVDSHSFELKINDFPKPTINNLTVTPSPSVYNHIVTPLDGPLELSFSVRNNVGLDNSFGVNWRTEWTISKNGSLLHSETDLFTSFGATDSNTAYLGTSPATPKFDPMAAGFGVGNYTVRAIVQNSLPGEIVDERLWTITVKHPDMGVVAAVTSPSPSVTTTAFHSVPYNLLNNTFGFYDANDPLRSVSNYCVEVSNPQGVYPDASPQDPTAKNVVVKFYKDGVGTPIYEGVTTNLLDTICFSDATPAQWNQLFFSDGSPTATQSKKLRARVFDEQTGLEMCIDGPICSLVSYPIDWNITVQPQNSPASVVILGSSAGDNLTYPVAPGVTTTSTNATVTQDLPFRVRFKITENKFEFDPFVDTNKYKFTATLRRGGVPVTSTGCNKEFSDPYPGTVADAGVNSASISCSLTIPSSSATATIPPDPHTLTIQVEDLESPVTLAANGGGGGVLANLVSWNLTVIEAQTAPVISNIQVLSGGAPVNASLTEKTTISFQTTVADAQKDTYIMKISKCGDALCTPAQRTDFTGNTTPPVVFGPGYTTNNQITYFIPENAIANNLTGNLYFWVELADIPDVVTGLDATFTAPATQIVTVFVNNWNSSPTINPANLTVPAVNTAATQYSVLSGNRFSISAAGAVTDLSAVGSGEETINYKWWISPAPPAAAAWTEIAGVPASSNTLAWTPGPELTTDQIIRFCVTDNSVTSPLLASDPSVAGTACSPSYFISPRPNLAKLATGAFNGEVAIHHVPSERLAYVAYATNGTIHVNKVTYHTNGTLNNSGMRVVSFDAVSTSSTLVKNLSITASENAVYVAYLADDTTSPGVYHARVRRINIRQNPAATVPETKGATVFAASTRKFDFTYSAISVTPVCSTPANCVFAPIPRTLTFNGDALASTDSIQVTVPPYTPVLIPASTVTPTPVGSICGNCPAQSQAETFAAALNTHASTDLQGLTATTSAGVVTFQGVEVTSSYESTGTITGMGKIVFADSVDRWYLPVINASLTGSNQNKIQILSDDDDLAFDTVNSTNIMSSLETASFVDNAISATEEMILGFINQSGQAKLVRVPLNGTTYDQAGAVTLPIFAGVQMNSLKVKASPGAINPFIYVVAKDISNEFRLARAPAALGSAADEKKAVDIADSVFADNALILNPASVIDMDVSPALIQGTETATSEARVSVVSTAHGAPQTYLFRWKKILANPFESLNCTECADIDVTGETMSSSTKVVTAPIVPVTIGNAGIVGENTRNIMPILRINDASSGTAEFGLINTNVESIQSTTRDTTGKFRPALFK